MHELFEFLKSPLVIRILILIIWLVVILVVIVLLKRVLKSRIEDSSLRYKAQKGVEIIGYGLIIIMLLISFTLNDIGDYSIVIGLFTAGLAFTLQELILSITGSFYIFFVRVYKPGDRIEINGIKGDVIDINSIYTTIMEIGEWVSTDNYSGRIVKISNAFVFKGPIKNYSLDFPFVWDELNIFITFQSDLDVAKKLVIETAQNQLANYAKASKARWSAMVERYYIENAAIEPSIAIKVTDNWVALNLRYITDYKKRRATQNELFEEIEYKIRATKGKVVLASASLQLLKIPEVDVNLKNRMP
ncbi:mechanosensitive ion channel family protein [Pareuzebyella sediminis]|uniref:mechanosensitive ion channel family protein n=1 Tax=Pareuzebyella sediminis TaxID=2607998 RepID=UPI0011EEBEC1|nr:mechanosensitive ion channel domain-containing protein [Pareuzebyella sediminis]